MEFRLLVEFSDKKGYLMTLYSDAGAEVTILIAILIVERIYKRHTFTLCPLPTH